MIVSRTYRSRIARVFNPRIVAVTALLILVFLHLSGAYAIQRFPKPEFESGYSQPETHQPAPRAAVLEMADVLVLAISLALISWLVLKKRSRMMVFFASLAMLAWFGFYRKGCICSIGAIQNVTLALFDSAYALPVTALAFFILPLVFTLFFGRTFCAGVCPFGALQDLVSFKPMKLGVRLNTVLGLIPYVYLGLAILFAATRTDFIICRYDPFVGIFRFDATFSMFLFTGALLLSGIFIARPYCRFLCPYGVLLNWISRFSLRHMTITPSKCIQCRLCEDSCPYGAIDIPQINPNPEDRGTTRRKLILVSFMIPVFIFLGGFTVSQLHETLAGVNSTVRLAKLLLDPAPPVGQAETFEMTAFRSSGKPVADVFAEASAIRRQFYIGSWILGSFLGLAFGSTLAGRMLRGYNPDYTPNRGACYSCARCMDFCPVDRKNELTNV